MHWLDEWMISHAINWDSNQFEDVTPSWLESAPHNLKEIQPIIEEATSSWVRRFSRASLNLNLIQIGLKMYSPAEWRVPRAPFSLNGIETHSKMYSPAEWRVPRVPFRLNGIQTHSKMYSPAGWWVSHAPLSACLLSRPEAKVGRWTRCFRTICWKPRHAGSTSTMRPSFGNMSPEGRNNVVQEFWLGQYSSQMIRTQSIQRIVAVFKQGLHIILRSSFALERKQVTLNINHLKT